MTNAVLDSDRSACSMWLAAPQAAIVGRPNTGKSTVFNALSDVRAAGIFVLVRVAQVVLQPILLQLRFEAGVETNVVALIARATAQAFVNGLNPGEQLDPADIIDRLKIVAGLDVQGDEVITPAGIVVPEALQVLRTSLNLTNTSVQSQQDVQFNQAMSPDVILLSSLQIKT